MKKIAFSIMAFAFTLAAMAGDWSLPVPKTVPLEYNKVVYFYNIDAKMFLTKGNSNGSQMSLGDTGLPVVVKQKDTEYTDGGTYVMLRNDEAKTYFDQAVSGVVGWVDRAEEEAMASELAVWKLQVNADGTFQFGVPNQSKVCENAWFDSEDPAYNAKLWAGWYGYADNTEVIPCLDTEIYTAGYLWTAVLEDEYTAFTATISQRKALLSLILEAEENDVTIPSRIASVFNSESATADELTAAYADLADMMLKHDLEVKGEADVTSVYVVNPNFDNDNYGWSNSVDNAYVADHDWWVTDTWQVDGGEAFNEAEDIYMQGYLKAFVWSGGWIGNLANNETSQTVTLPAGKYRLEADCFALQEGDGAERYGSSQDWSGQIKGFYLFAKNDLGEVCAEIESEKNDKTPHRYKVEFQSAGGETTFGLKIEKCFGSQFAADNFRLICTGLMSSPELVELQTIADEMQKTIEAYIDAPFSMETLAQAETFVSNAEDALRDGDDAASVTLIAEGKGLKEKIAAEIEAYQRVRDAYDETCDYIDNGEFVAFGEEIVAQILNNANEMMSHIDEGDVTPEAAIALIDDYTSKLAHIIAADVNEYDDGMDVTCLLQNGQFSRGEEWNGGSGKALPGWNGERPWTYNLKGGAAGQIEYFNQDFDLYQELKNMPAGVYTIEFRGFYRWGQKDAVIAAMDTPEGKANNTSRFYLNNFESPIKAVTDDAFPLPEGDEAGNGNYPIGKTDEEGNELYMPDAIWYYMWRNTDRHINTGAVLVEEGQSLRIGFRASGDDSERWSLISAPKLRYEGTSERAMGLLDPTAISAPSAETLATAGIYNLCGQRVSTPQRGVNIVVARQADGSLSVRKILVK